MARRKNGVTRHQNSKKIRNMLLIAMFAALTAIGAFLRIPTPLVPFTLQFLFCAYAGLFLGWRRGMASQLLYVGLGLIGIPVFTQGGGPAYVLQPTFGFLIGYILGAGVMGYGRGLLKSDRFFPLLGVVLCGINTIYICGFFYLHGILTLYLGKSLTLGQTFMIGIAPYIPSDFILSIIIALTATKVLPILRRQGFIED